MLKNSFWHVWSIEENNKQENFIVLGHNDVLLFVNYVHGRFCESYGILVGFNHLCQFVQIRVTLIIDSIYRAYPLELEIFLCCYSSAASR